MLQLLKFEFVDVRKLPAGKPPTPNILLLFKLVLAYVLIINYSTTNYGPGVYFLRHIIVVACDDAKKTHADAPGVILLSILLVTTFATTY